MSLEIPIEQFKKLGNLGVRKFLKVGGSYYISIPSIYFKCFWNKEDYIDIYFPNDYMMIILNKKAKERMEKSNEVKVENLEGFTHVE
jgi:hypothetical protein